MQRNLIYASLAFMLMSFASCELIGDIFKTGFYAGIIAVILVVGLVIWLISRLFGGRR